MSAVRHNLREIADSEAQIIAGEHPQYDDNCRSYIEECRASIETWKARIEWLKENYPNGAKDLSARRMTDEEIDAVLKGPAPQPLKPAVKRAIAAVKQARQG